MAALKETRVDVEEGQLMLSLALSHSGASPLNLRTMPQPSATSAPSSQLSLAWFTSLTCFLASLLYFDVTDKIVSTGLSYIFWLYLSCVVESHFKEYVHIDKTVWKNIPILLYLSLQGRIYE